MVRDRRWTLVALLIVSVAWGVPVPAAAADTDSFTIVVIPDTQGYTVSAALAPQFTAQTQWIVDQREELNTQFALQVGDLVESHPNTAQWTRAGAAMAVLDAAGVPNSVLPGNHDLSLSTGEAINYDATFPVSRYAQASWNSPLVSYGGYLGQNQFGADPINRQNKNNFALLTVGEIDLLILNLEYEMPEYSVAWAQRVIDAHPDRTVIMATHGWITTTGAWMDWRLRTDTETNTAVAVFDKFVRTNCSIAMVVAGHMHDGDLGEARRSDLNNCGRPVHQVLSNYQSRINGGDGWLRYYTFHPAEDRVDAFTYSPTLDAFETDDSSQFSLPIDLESTPVVPVTLVSPTASWRWLRTPTAWPAGWTGTSFDDAGWASGAAPLGFGSTTITTTIDVPPPTSGRPRSNLFRHTFTVDDPTLLSDLVLTSRADDGVVLYLNGIEVSRTRLPAGTLTALSYATAAPRTAAATAAPITVPIPTSLLQPGTNVISAATHLNYRGTPDLSFAAGLTGVQSVPDPGEPVAVTPVSAGSTWSYRSAAGAWPATWAQTSFDDSTWATGPAPLGFGSAGIVTTVDVPPPTSNRPVSALYRNEFTLDNAAAYSDLTLTTRADDGVVVRVNGVEVGRSKMPTTAVGATTYASAAPRTTAAIAAPVSFVVPAALLVDGVNVVAVSVHLNYRATADASFDLQLTGQRSGQQAP